MGHYAAGSTTSVRVVAVPKERHSICIFAPQVRRHHPEVEACSHGMPEANLSAGVALVRLSRNRDQYLRKETRAARERSFRVLVPTRRLELYRYRSTLTPTPRQGFG